MPFTIAVREKEPLRVYSTAWKVGRELDQLRRSETSIWPLQGTVQIKSYPILIAHWSHLNLVIVIRGYQRTTVMSVITALAIPLP